MLLTLKNIKEGQDKRVMKKLLLFFSIMVGVLLVPFLIGFFSLSSSKDHYENVLDFREWQKPLTPEYLYQLVDYHPEEKQRLDSYFKVQKIYNLQPGSDKKVISYSLFMKYAYEEQGAPVVNRETIHVVSERYKGKSWYELYAAPLVRSLTDIKTYYPGWTARIYLANDLAFMIDDIFCNYPDAEIFLMDHSSIAHNPGAMWRFLIFDDKDVSAAMVMDVDDSYTNKRSRYDLIQTWVNDNTKQGWMRHKFWDSYDRFETFPYPKVVHYHPIIGCNFGWKRTSETLDMEKAMKGFILHRQLFPEEPRYYKDVAFEKHPYGFGNKFPNYGIDERFLARVIYYYAADKGELYSVREPPKLYKIKDISFDNPMLSDVAYIEHHKKETR